MVAVVVTVVVAAAGELAMVVVTGGAAGLLVMFGSVLVVLVGILVTVVPADNISLLGHQEMVAAAVVAGEQHRLQMPHQQPEVAVLGYLVKAVMALEAQL
jgi:hypothetical protein